MTELEIITSPHNQTKHFHVNNKAFERKLALVLDCADATTVFNLSFSLYLSCFNLDRLKVLKQLKDKNVEKRKI